MINARCIRIFSAVLTFAVFSGCAVSDIAGIPKPEGKVVVEDGIYATMRDGVRLSGRLYHPPGEGPWPVILNRLPYGVDQVDPFAKYFAGKGYAFFAQDTRGRYNSGGGGDTFYPFFPEERDGRDTIEWLAAQRWCDGKIGTWGGSYHGMTQWALAARNDKLSAMAPIVTSTDLYRWHYMGGALRLEMMLGWGFQNMGRTSRPLRSIPEKRYRHLPLTEADDAARGDWPYWDDVIAHPLRDDFWKPLYFTDDIKDVNAPALFISGWYDIFNADQIRDYHEWERRGVDRPPARLVVGPWNHVFYNRNLKNVEWGWRDASGVILGECAQWFDRWLKGVHNGVEDLAPVKLFVMGDNEWREFDAWPVKGTRKFTFYLHSAGGAADPDGSGVLSVRSSMGDEAIDEFVYDPATPVPTIGGPGLSPFNAGPADQRGVEKRDDVLVYTSEDVLDDLTVIGAIRVKLFASTDAPNTDFTAKLVDLRPDGKAIIVAEGILRGSFMNGNKPLEPGKIYEWNIDLGFTAIAFKPGHSVRLELSSSNFPRFDRNLNTADERETGASMRKARQKIYHSKQYPSQLVLEALE